MINLLRPERTLDQLRKIAASGSSGLARQAQRELQERTTADLRKAVGRQ